MFTARTLQRFRIVPSGLWPLLSASFVSTAGDSLHQVAIMWLIYELTGSSAATGLLGMAQYLPAVLLGLFAGAAVDRLDRKKVMIAADAARVVLVALIPTLYLLGMMTGLLLGLFAFAIAIFTTAFSPARDAIIPSVVESEELTRAGSQIQITYGMAFFAGPLIAAALLPIARLSGLFYADAVSYGVSLLFLLRLRPRVTERIAASISTLKQVSEGLSYARSHGLIRGLLMITAVDNLFIMGPALIGSPLYVRLHLHLGASAFAATQAAFALGMITGGLLVGQVSRRIPRGKILIAALIFDGLTFVPFYFADSLLGAVVIWYVHSIGIPFIIVPRTTLVQTEVPPELQGRIFSLVNITVVGLTSISCGLSGLALTLVTPGQLFAIIGIFAGLIGALGYFFVDLRGTH